MGGGGGGAAGGGMGVRRVVSVHVSLLEHNYA